MKLSISGFATSVGSGDCGVGSPSASAVCGAREGEPYITGAGEQVAGPPIGAHSPHLLYLSLSLSPSHRRAPPYFGSLRSVSIFFLRSPTAGRRLSVPPSPMGCGVSKLEPGEGPASGQVTRRRQNDGSPANKDGTVSASLLRPEELDDAAPPVADGKATMTTQVESKCARQEQGEGQDKQQQRLSQNKRAGSTGEELQDKMSQGDTKKREGEGAKRASYSRGPALNDGRRARSGDDEEEFPGSPSFRVYFVEPAPEFSDDDSVISAISSAGKIKGRKCIIPTGEDSMKPIISEESVEKVSKRQWRRFKGLSRKPAGGVYSLLNVRSLYSSPNAGCHQEGGLPHTTNTAGGGAGRTSNAGPP